MSLVNIAARRELAGKAAPPFLFYYIYTRQSCLLLFPFSLSPYIRLLSSPPAHYFPLISYTYTFVCLCVYVYVNTPRCIYAHYLSLHLLYIYIYIHRNVSLCKSLAHSYIYIYIYTPLYGVMWQCASISSSVFSTSYMRYTLPLSSYTAHKSPGNCK